MYGAIEFYKLCIKNNIQPIIGLTVDVESEIEKEVSYPLVLLAENEKGFKNLLKISSAVQTKATNGIPFKWLKHYAEGLIAISPGIEGEIEQNLLNDQPEQAIEIIKNFSPSLEESHFTLLFKIIN